MDFTFTQTQLLAIRASLVAVFVLFVLVFLEPFQIHRGGTDFRFISLLAGYGVVGGFIILMNEWKVIPLLKPFIANKKIVFVADYIWQLLIVAVGICFYSRFIDAAYPIYNFPSFSYWEALEKTFLVSVIPISIDLSFQYSKRRQKQSSLRISPLLHLKGELTNDWLKIKADQLLFITPSDNYVSIHYLENQTIHKKLLRSTLKNMETQLKDFPICRCHQSFIVNLALVRSTKGSRRAMKLELLHCENLIPVSRKYVQIIADQLDIL